MSQKNVLGLNLNLVVAILLDGIEMDHVEQTCLIKECILFVLLSHEQFLSYSKAQGNDLSTPQIGFPGLKKGDHWCLCAPRWKEAFEDGMAPLINLEATEESTLKIIDIETLKKFSQINKK